MTPEEKARLQAVVVSNLKQSCLDLSGAVMDLFDRFDEHGLEAAWAGDGALVVMRMQKAHEELRSFLARQVTQRMLALGVDAETLARMDIR